MHPVVRGVVPEDTDLGEFDLRRRLDVVVLLGGVLLCPVDGRDLILLALEDRPLLQVPLRHRAFRERVGAGAFRRQVRFEVGVVQRSAARGLGDRRGVGLVLALRVSGGGEGLQLLVVGVFRRQPLLPVHGVEGGEILPVMGVVLLRLVEGRALALVPLLDRGELPAEAIAGRFVDGLLILGPQRRGLGQRILVRLREPL